MGWAEMGLGPRADAKESERAGRAGSRGAVIIDPARAKQRFKTILGSFFGGGVWICLLVIAGFVALRAAGSDGALETVAALVAIAAVGYTLVWLGRLAYWGMHSLRS